MKKLLAWVKTITLLVLALGIIYMAGSMLMAKDQGDKEYIVQVGDTVSSIVEKEYDDFSTISKLRANLIITTFNNGCMWFRGDNRIYADQKLYIPIFEHRSLVEMICLGLGCCICIWAIVCCLNKKIRMFTIAFPFMILYLIFDNLAKSCRWFSKRFKCMTENTLSHIPSKK